MTKMAKMCVMEPHLTEDLRHLGAGRVHASPHVEHASPKCVFHAKTATHSDTNP